MESNKDGGTTVGFSNEPYMGWCDVEFCPNEGANGGGCWRETGYWTVCSKHSQEHREGKPQPKMKQSAIDRENSRDGYGYLPPTKTDFHIEENLEQINKQQWEDIENEFKNERQFKFWSDVFDWLKENYNAPEKK